MIRPNIFCHATISNFIFNHSIAGYRTVEYVAIHSTYNQTVIFFKNFAGQGGGMYVAMGSPKFKNLYVVENEAGVGAGICRYVTQTGNGNKDGSSWQNASDDIQAMINISERGDSVWVAEGKYNPTHTAAGWTGM